jgi:SET family sugar efflux transporter-like MFS transporter
MSSTLAPASRRSSPVRQVRASPLFRGATVAVFLSGIGMSAAAPQIALFLVRDLGASLTTAGLYYLTNLMAPIAGYLVGSRSDRTGGRLGLFRVCALLGFLGWAGIAFSTQIWMLFVLSAVFLGFAGAAGSQLFAAVHDELVRRPESGGDGVVAFIRMALTAGWVIGPVAGAALAAQMGLRAMLMATALCTLAQIVPLGFLRTPPPAPVVVPGPDDAAAGAVAPVPGRRPPLRMMWPLLAFTGLYILVYAGESVKYAFLPIYMTEQLRLPAAISGAVIGIQPLVELLIMPFSVILARRVGPMQLMAIGAALGVAANLCFALSGTAAGMFAGQILMGGVWGVFAALGIIVAQRLLPTAVATASAIFMSSTAISSALGGLAGGLGGAAIGLPLVFLIPGFFGVLATIGLLVMAKTTPIDR